MKKTKKRIFAYTAQPIEKLGLTFVILLLFTSLIFVLLSLTIWQEWDILRIDHIGIRIVISVCLCLALFRDKQHFFKFPFWIQRHLINTKLALDLNELALRSSDAIVRDYQEIKTPWWQAKKYVLLLELNPHEKPQWFEVNFAHIFNQHEFLKLDLKPTAQLIGQQVLLYYLARSHQIIQLYQLHPKHDLSTAHAYVNAVHIANIHFEQIPTRLMLDLPKVVRIEAMRRNDCPVHVLKLTTSYGQVYHISAQTAHFDKLELALARLIDFIRYRNFKQNSNIQHCVLTTTHPLCYRHIVFVIIIALLLFVAVFFKDLSMLLFGVLCIYVYSNTVRNFNASPWLENEEFK